MNSLSTDNLPTLSNTNNVGTPGNLNGIDINQMAK